METLRLVGHQIYEVPSYITAHRRFYFVTEKRDTVTVATPVGKYEDDLESARKQASEMLGKRNDL